MNIRNLIDESFIGVIWIADGSPQSLQVEQDLDYLMDGLISQNQIKSEDRPHFFHSYQFDRPFFVIKLNDKEGLNDNLTQINSITPSPTEDRDKILFVMPSGDKKVATKLNKIFEQYKILHLEQLLPSDVN